MLGTLPEFRHTACSFTIKAGAANVDANDGSGHYGRHAQAIMFLTEDLSARMFNPIATSRLKNAAGHQIARAFFDPAEGLSARRRIDGNPLLRKPSLHHRAFCIAAALEDGK